MKHFIRNIALAAAAAVGFAGAASAAVVSINITGGTPGITSSMTAPAAVGNNSINKQVLYAFDEQQSVLLGSNLNVDYVAGTIAAGTRVASHYIAFDPAPLSSVEATVTFNRKILGLIFTQSNLLASDYLGAAGVFYDTSRLIGLELGDLISFSSDMTSLSWTASVPGDHIRVITAAVPLPAGGILLIGGLGALALMRRRKAAA